MFKIGIFSNSRGLSKGVRYIFKLSLVRGEDDEALQLLLSRSPTAYSLACVGWPDIELDYVTQTLSAG